MKNRWYLYYVFRWYIFFYLTLYFIVYFFFLFYFFFSGFDDKKIILTFIFGLLPLIILLLVIFAFKKQFCSKIIVEEEGIEIFNFVKKPIFIQWSDIKQINSYFSFSGYKYMNLISKNVSIEFNVNSTIVKTLLFYIKNESINQQLKNVQTHKYRMAMRGLRFNK